MSGVSLSHDTECRSLGFVNNPPRGYFRTVKTCIPKSKNLNVAGNLCVGGVVQTDALVPKTLTASPPTIRVEGDLCVDGTIKATEDCANVAKGDVRFNQSPSQIEVVQRGLSAIEHIATGQVRLTLSQPVALDHYRFVCATLGSVSTCDHLSYTFEDASQQSLLVQTTALASGAAVDGFEGDFAPNKWAVMVDGNGSATFQDSPPDSLVLVSRDGGQSPAGGDSKVCITVPCPTTLRFDWQYSTANESSHYDPFGFEINGNSPLFTELTQLVSPTNADQSGSETIQLNTGDTFCFVQRSVDGGSGAATTIITNFTSTECCDFVDRSFCFGVDECPNTSTLTNTLFQPLA